MVLTSVQTAEVQVTVEDGVQTLRLQRPEKKNALTQAMYQALTNALNDGENNSEVGAFMFVGSGGCFTAGNDIKDFLEAASTEDDDSDSSEVLTFIRTLPKITKPIVAAVEGVAVGIGTTMLFHCDLVYASPNTIFATPFIDLGLVPEAGSSLLMPSRLGYARAAEMLLLGERASAEQMHAAGVVNAIVASEDLEAHAHAAAKKLAQKPPAALALTRQLMRGDGAMLEAQIQKEITVFSQQMVSPEAREAFQAFLEKRPPDFSKFR